MQDLWRGSAVRLKRIPEEHATAEPAPADAEFRSLPPAPCGLGMATAQPQLRRAARQKPSCRFGKFQFRPAESLEPCRIAFLPARFRFPDLLPITSQPRLAPLSGPWPDHKRHLSPPIQ